jgi:DNA mismatch repair protein MutL
VNGRLIRDRLLLHALAAGYANIIPPNAYPFALLFLDCSAEEVDVNVHPSKTEVRFRRGTFVHDFVRDAVRQILTAARPVSTLPPSPGGQAAARLPYSEFTQTVENAEYRTEPEAVGAAPVVAGEAAPEFKLHAPPPPQPLPGRFDFGPTQRFPVAGDAPVQTQTVAPPNPRRSRVPDTHGPLPPGLSEEPAASMEVLRDLRPVAQLHDSFIVAVGPDGLWIIDQHVAHERILFEKVLAQMAAGRVEKQQLLMPILIELSAAQQTEYQRVSDDLQSVGFELEPFGPRTISVNAAPADLSTAEVERVIFEILEIAEQELRQTSIDELRRQMAASIACRAAIKINNPLDLERMQWLLEALAQTEFPMSCPHGRPIALRYATREILKNFHRI